MSQRACMVPLHKEHHNKQTILISVSPYTNLHSRLFLSVSVIPTTAPLAQAILTVHTLLHFNLEHQQHCQVRV